MASLPSLRSFLRLAPSLRLSVQIFGFFSVPVGLTIMFNDQLLETTSIDGCSMAPTLSPDFDTTGERDYIAWSKRQPSENLRRGDIVLFANPVKPEGNAVKRIVALEGDVIMLDPRRRPGKKTGDGPEGRRWDAWRGKVVVPEGHVWVEGDNWRESRDSNWYGPISTGLIGGKAMSVVYPFHRCGEKPWVAWKGGRTNVLPGRIEVRGSWKLEGEGVV